MVHGNEFSIDDLSAAMLRLQERGAHNINLVTASHCVWPFIEGLAKAAEQGLEIPIVYNSSGYDGKQALRLLDGIVDVYMPDLKYADNQVAKKLSGPSDYWEVATTALKEMHRQVGDLKLDDEGIAVRGMIVRHLVLPEILSGTKRVLKFIAEELGKQTTISLMSQFFPANKSHDILPLNRPLEKSEFDLAKEWLQEYGLDNGWVQDD
jgi:putative pyruvate formate lyase activating enzyme